MEEKEREKLAIDLFIQYADEDLAKFKQAVSKGKMIMMRDIHLDKRFRPKKYVRYYLTFRVLKMPEKQPIPPFDVMQHRIERMHNAALTLELLEMELNRLNPEDKYYCYFEIGGVYVLSEGETEDKRPWYDVSLS